MLVNNKAYIYAKNALIDDRVPKYVKLQCKEFLDIVENKNDKYILDLKTLEKVEGLTKLMNMASGLRVGQTVYDTLVGFQWLFIISVLCIKHRNDLEKRKVEMATMLIARKCGKSALIGILFVLLLLLEPQNSESYSVASDGSLSRIVKKEIEQLLGASPVLSKRFKIRRDDIKCNLNNNIYVPLNFSTGRMDGRKPNFWLCDEAGSLPTTYPIDAMKSGQINMKNRLGVIISTAYPTEINPMVDEVEYAKKVLDGAIEDETYFSLLYEPDNKNDWKSDLALYQSNPLALEIKENLDYLKKQRQEAIDKPSSETNFKTKHLNIFVNDTGGEGFIDFNDWKKTEVEEIDFSGKEVVIALDLSVSIDLSSVNASYREGNNYYSMSWGFLGRESLSERREKFNYIASEKRGECFINEGRIVDYNAIKDFILGFEDKYNCKIKCIISDPYNANELLRGLEEELGCDVIMLKQTYSNLSEPTKQMQRAIIEGRYFHKKSKLYDLHISDTQLSVGRSGDIMIDKSALRKKKGAHIDLVASSIFSLKVLLEDEESYDMVSALDNLNWD